jgi:predicted MFS family arabinose efflux permease
VRAGEATDDGVVRLTATVTVAMAVSTLPQFLLGALGPFIIRDLSLTRSVFGVGVSVFYLVGGVASPVAGPLVDALGPRALLLALFSVSGVALVVVALSQTFPVLLAALAIGGVAVAISNPVTNKLIVGHVIARRRGIVMGVKQSGVQLGAFLAGAALPPIAAAAGWHRAVLATVPLALLGGVLTVAFVPRAPRSAGRARSLDRPPREPLPGAVSWLACYALLMGLGTAAVPAYLPLYAFEELGLSAERAGMLAGAIGLTGIVSRVWWGHRSERASAPAAVLAVLAGSAAVSTALLPAAPRLGEPALWVGAAAFGLGAVAWNAVANLVIVNMVSTGEAGRASGWVQLAFFVGLIVGPLPFGIAVDRAGYLLAWSLLVVIFVHAVAVSLLWGARQPVGA